MPTYLGRARLGNRLNAFRLGHFDVSCAITVGGTVRSNTILKSSLTINDIKGSTPNTASFTTKAVPGWTPTRGQEVLIGLGSISNLIFGGQIEAVEQRQEAASALSAIQFQVTCTDYTRLLNRRKVWAVYDGTEAHIAVISLLDTYTSGFTDHTKIQTGLGLVSALEFEGADVTDVLDALATAVGATWFVDYTRRVHFFTTSTQITPTAITSAHPTARAWSYKRMLRQARTRIYVKGASSKIAAPVSVGQTILPVEDIARFVGGTAAIVGPQILTYSGTSVTTDDTAALVAGSPQSIAAPTLALARSASTVSVSSIERSGQTATVTTGAAHGFAVGLTVKIAGAVENDYNGSFAIDTVPLTTTFTVTVPGSPSTPATGTITAQKVMGGPIVGVVSHKISAVVARTSGSSTRNLETNVGTASSNATGETLAAPAALVAAEGHSASTVAISSITRSGSVATVTTGAAHGYSAGLQVTIAGTGEAAYNGTFTIATVASTTTFTYPIAGAPTTPAGGTKTAQAVMAGTLIGAYRYRYADVSARGETLASAEATVTTTEVAAPAAATVAEAHSATTSAVTITRSGTTATVSLTAHGFAAGMSVTISGATETPYNGTFTIVAVTSANAFTYSVAGAPATPATGSPIVQARTSGPLIGAYEYRFANVTRDGETLQSASASVTATEIAAPGNLGVADSTTVDGGLPAGAYTYKTSYVSATGETAPVGGVADTIPTITAPGAPTQTVSTTVDGGVAAGNYFYKIAYLTSRGATAIGTASSTATIAVVSAPGAPTVGETTGGSLTLLARYDYVVTYYTASGETTVGSAGTKTLTGSNNACSLTSIPTSADGRVVGRKIYRSKANGISPFYLVATIGDNTTTTYTDIAPDSALSVLAPTANTTGSQVALTSIPTSADGRVSGRKICRTKAGGSVYYVLATLADNVTTTYTDTTPDTSLTELGPTVDTTGGQMNLTSIPTSADARVLARRLYRTKVGGSVYYLLTTISDNTTTTYTDTTLDSSLITTAPSEGQNHGAAIKITAIPISTDPRVVARRIYRTMTAAVGFKLLATIGDNTTTTYTDTTPDASLGASAPTEGSGHGAAVRLTSIAVSTDPRVVARRIYRTVAGGTEFRLLATIGDNVSISYTDTTPDSGLGGTMPATNTFGGDSILVTAIPLGPTGTIARKVYRTLAGGSVYKYVGSIPDNTTTTYTDSRADSDLGEEAPAASQLGPVAGDTTLRVSDLSKFNANGGWTVISGQPIRYTGRAASSGEGNLTGIPSSGAGSIIADLTVAETVANKGYLTGIPSSGAGSVTKAIEQGTTIRLRVTREDTAAQTALGTLEGGDGIHEHTIDAGDLATVADCNLAGDKELDDFDAGEDTFEWTSRDPNTRSTVPTTVSLGAPHSISASFITQDVTWTQFETITNKVNGVDIFGFPLGRATAGRTRLTLVDLLRMVEAAR